MSGITGVAVQISRRSGNVWNVISLTNNWTLDRQNTTGAYVSSIMAAGPEAQGMV
jgi:hypothetical protein